MCGIVGFVTNPTFRKDWAARKTALEAFMREGLYADALRGNDGTGIARVHYRNIKAPAEVYKKSIPAADYMQLRGTTRILEEIDDVAFMIGHNRYATRGAFKGDQSAHPFQVDNITLVHNGGLNGYFALTKRNPADVDSAYIAGAFADRPALDVLPELDGVYSLVWHDATDGTLNFARNSSRPMFFLRLGTDEKDWPGFVYGSEPHMLQWLLERNGIPYHGDCVSTALHTIYKFEHTAPFAPTRIQYKPKGVQARGFQGGGVTASTPPASTKASQSAIGKSTSTPSSGHQESPTPTTGINNRPLNRKEQRRDEALRSVKLRLGAIITATPEEWMVSKKNPRVGVGHFSHSLTNLPIQIPNLSANAWNSCVDRSAAVRCLSLRHEGKRPVVIAEWVGAFSQKQETVEPARVPGPIRGSKIPMKLFLDLTKGGCTVCDGWVNPDKANDMEWLRFPNARPLPVCHVCSEDPTVREKFGLDDDDTDELATRVLQ